MGLRFCLLLCIYHSMCVSSWVVSEIQSIPHKYLCFGHRLFPDLGETWLPDERIPHSVSLKCHQEEVTGGRNRGRDTKGPFPLIYFPPPSVRKQSQPGIGSARLRERPDMKESSQDGRQCVWSTQGWGRNKKIKRNLQRVLMTGDE